MSMRKRIGVTESASATHGGGWLDIERCASVEVSSEDTEHPIEGAFVDSLGGWRAGSAGIQTVRLTFDEPTRIRRILIEVREGETERTQELAISCTSTNGHVQEIIRQRWNFSPRGSTRELEDYRVDLSNVTVLEVTIQPDVHDQSARASLAQLRVG